MAYLQSHLYLRVGPQTVKDQGLKRLNHGEIMASLLASFFYCYHSFCICIFIARLLNVGYKSVCITGSIGTSLGVLNSSPCTLVAKLYCVILISAYCPRLSSLSRCARSWASWYQNRSSMPLKSKTRENQQEIKSRSKVRARFSSLAPW